MEKIGKFLNKYLWIAVLLLSIPAVWSLFTPGFFGVSDDTLVGWLYEMDKAVKIFQIPPRFVPDLSFGFGYPLFNFVYPLPFYIGELFHLTGFSLVDSAKIVFGLSIPFSMFFMYRFLKEFLNKELSLAGAVLYVYAPYRATEMFVRGAIGEIVAFVFIPLVALSFIKLTKEKISKYWVGITGLSVAALVLSHNIIAYMFFPLALVLLAARIIFLVKDKKKAILGSLIGILLGLLTSAYFWLPAIYESGLMKYGTVFNYADHFPTLKQLITPYFGYGASVPGPYDWMSFYMGIIGMAVVLAGGFLFVKNWKKHSKEEKVIALWATLVFFGSIFMMNHRSAFLWKSIPLIPYFQFPWRFLAMIVFSAPLFLLAFTRTRYAKAVAFVVITLSIAFNLGYFKPEKFLGRGDGYYINRYIPYPNASQEYLTTSEEYLRLPQATEIRPKANYPRAYSDKNIVGKVEELNALDAIIRTDSNVEATLNYNKYAFPGWIAKIDGKQVEIVAGKPYGQISVSVPSGNHVIEIFYRETTFRKILNYISLAGILAALWLLLTGRKINEK